MKILITGATGLLGSHLIRYAKHTVYSTYFNVIPKDLTNKYQMDVGCLGRIRMVFKIVKPDVVIHTANIACVDYCEDNREEVNVTNLRGTVNIIKCCKERNAKLVYISSNAVFNGEDPPYSEEDDPNPVNYYGLLKSIEEAIVKNSRLDWLIIRPILMYGWNHPKERKNPVTWLIDELTKGHKVKIVDDIYCNPLLVDDCAKAIWKLIGKDGIYHIGGKDRASRYELSLKAAEVFGLDEKLIEPVRNNYFDIAPRPKDTTYSIKKINKLGIKTLGIKKGLIYMKNGNNSFKRNRTK